MFRPLNEGKWLKVASHVILLWQQPRVNLDSDWLLNWQNYGQFGVTTRQKRRATYRLVVLWSIHF
jgi:hypothetical protein